MAASWWAGDVPVVDAQLGICWQVVGKGGRRKAYKTQMVVCFVVIGWVLVAEEAEAAVAAAIAEWVCLMERALFWLLLSKCICVSFWIRGRKIVWSGEKNSKGGEHTGSHIRNAIEATVCSLVFKLAHWSSTSTLCPILFPSHLPELPLLPRQLLLSVHSAFSIDAAFLLAFISFGDHAFLSNQKRNLLRTCFRGWYMPTISSSILHTTQVYWHGD